MSSQEITTVALDREAKQRLETLRPYESMSWREFSLELADVYEAYRNEEEVDSHH